MESAIRKWGSLLQSVLMMKIFGLVCHSLLRKWRNLEEGGCQGRWWYFCIGLWWGQGWWWNKVLRGAVRQLHAVSVGVVAWGLQLDWNKVHLFLERWALEHLHWRIAGEDGNVYGSIDLFLEIWALENSHWRIVGDDVQCLWFAEGK